MADRRGEKNRDRSRKRGGRNKRHQSMPLFAPRSSPASQLDVDLHGLNSEEAERRVIREIESVPDHFETICFIHGFTRGNVLTTVVRDTVMGLRKRFDKGVGITIVHLDD